MKRLALALACLAGCAHLESRAAAPGDERAVMVVLSSSNPFCDECRAFDGKLANREVASALAHVRVVRYDVDSPSGSEALERLLGPRLPLHAPLAVGVVEDRAVLSVNGATASVDTVLAFVEQLAALGGDGAEYSAIAGGGDASPEVMLRAARWHDARRHGTVAVSLWRRLSARADAPPDARAEADWMLAALERNGAAWESRAALDFAARHPATWFGWSALVRASRSGKVTRDEIATVVRRDFAAAAPVGRQADVVLVALATGDGDVALELARSLVGDGSRAAPKELLALAEVMYARGQAAQAVTLAERALAAAPTAPSVQESLERYRRHGGPAPAVRALILAALPPGLSGWLEPRYR